MSDSMGGDFLSLLVGATVFGFALMLLGKRDEDGSFVVDLMGLFVTIFAGSLFLTDVYEYIQKYIL